jgi:hypothetical protein
VEEELEEADDEGPPTPPAAFSLVGAWKQRLITRVHAHKKVSSEGSPKAARTSGVCDARTGCTHS